MAQAPDSGGGGSTTSVCTISGTDIVSSLDNLMSRVERIETILSALLGMDITTAQLSDITSNAGILEDIAAVLANESGGWITDGTFTGVAISSLGWPFYNACTGEYEQWPIVTMQDGVLNFGLSSSGQACGSQVQQWNGASSVAFWATDALHTVDNNYSGFGAFNESNKYDPDGLTQKISSTVLHVTKTGFYLVTLGVKAAQGAGGTGRADVFVEINNSGYPPGMSYSGQQGSGVDIDVEKDLAYAQTFSSARLCWIENSADIDIGYSYESAANTGSFGNALVTFQLVKEVA